jgi:hypothetical protein
LFPGATAYLVDATALEAAVATGSWLPLSVDKI